jgi:hypothetical protein
VSQRLTFQRDRVREWGGLGLLMVGLGLGGAGPVVLLLKALVFVLIGFPALRRAHLPAAEILDEEIIFHKSIFSCDVVFRRSGIRSWRYYADNEEIVVTAEGGFSQAWKTKEFTKESRVELLEWLSLQIPSGRVIEQASIEIS